MALSCGFVPAVHSAPVPLNRSAVLVVQLFEEHFAPGHLASEQVFDYRRVVGSVRVEGGKVVEDFARDGQGCNVRGRDVAENVVGNVVEAVIGDDCVDEVFEEKVLDAGLVYFRRDDGRRGGGDGRGVVDRRGVEGGERFGERSGCAFVEF